MNTAFKSMSDLVADTEDLIAKVVHSQTPEVRALARCGATFRQSGKRAASRARASIAPESRHRTLPA